MRRGTGLKHPQTLPGKVQKKIQYFEGWRQVAAVKYPIISTVSIPSTLTNPLRFISSNHPSPFYPLYSTIHPTQSYPFIQMCPLSIQLNPPNYLLLYPFCSIFSIPPSPFQSIPLLPRLNQPLKILLPLSCFPKYHTRTTVTSQNI